MNTIPMNLILTGIREGIFIKPYLIEYAIKKGYIERITQLELTLAGREFLRESRRKQLEKDIG